MTPDDPRHGIRAGYIAGCRCLPCRRANARWLKEYRVTHATTGPRRLPAEPAQAHIRNLQRTMSLGTIAAAAGLSRDAVRNLLNRRTVTPRVSAAVMSVHPNAAVSRHQVAAHGTVRRLRALACLGYTVRDVCATSGRSPRSLEALRRLGETSAYVHGNTALAVTRAYDQLWMTPRPLHGLSQQQRGHVTHTIRLAAREGWAPPLAWDDATIDDPDAVPVGAGYKPGHRIEQIRELEQLGLTRAGIADRLGVTENAIARAIERANRQENAA